MKQVLTIILFLCVTLVSNAQEKVSAKDLNAVYNLNAKIIEELNQQIKALRTKNSELNAKKTAAEDRASQAAKNTEDELMETLKSLNFKEDTTEESKNYNDFITKYRKFRDNSKFSKRLKAYHTVMAMIKSLNRGYDKTENDKFLDMDFDDIKAQLLEPQQKTYFDEIALKICDYKYIMTELKKAIALIDAKQPNKISKEIVADIQRIEYTSKLFHKYQDLANSADKEAGRNAIRSEISASLSK